MSAPRPRGLPAAVALALAAAVAAAWPPAAVSQTAAGDAEAVVRATHLLSRATWGVRPSDLEAALEIGPEAWLERQLHPARIDDAALESRLAALPTLALTPGDLYERYSPDPAQRQAQQRLQALRDSLGDDAPAVRELQRELRTAQAARRPQALLNDLVTARIQRSVHGERQLEDVMTDFWFNHFNVFFNKGQDRYLVGDYERSAIRPHVFGRFEDMLIATAQHPAMLFYLDNWQSVWVDTARAAAAGQELERLRRRLQGMSEAQRERLVASGRVTREQIEALERGESPMMRVAQRARDRGLNENYARELLELHTLGVDGGYTQEDVVAVARAFTGWSFQAPTGRAARDVAEPTFVFRRDQHDPDEKVVLGTALPAGRGIEDGLEVLRMVARHPSTARHVATELVERFVADEPPADLVDHLAEVFLATGGDLREVTRALFASEAFHRPEHVGTKVKTPYELVVSALRASGAEVTGSPRLLQTLREMGHLPYGESAPTGYPAQQEDWVSTAAMLSRMSFAVELAGGRVPGARIPRPGVGGAGASADPAAVLARLLPGADTERLARVIAEELEAHPPAPRERAATILGLALGSPEFQRR